MSTVLILLVSGVDVEIFKTGEIVGVLATAIFGGVTVVGVKTGKVAALVFISLVDIGLAVGALVTEGGIIPLQKTLCACK